VNVGDLVMWRYPADRSKPEFGMIIASHKDGRSTNIKVVDLNGEHQGSTDWWDTRAWKAISEIDLTDDAEPATLKK
jgi:hypothetical protein